ncbi:MAG: hypothetical protein K8I00_06490, partial [Candidatus Omnitrophica bacterium]|nr:hypothetical protein [Candidatus Omnitrophota bacterium]
PPSYNYKCINCIYLKGYHTSGAMPIGIGKYRKTITVAQRDLSSYTGNMKDGLVLFAAVALVFAIMVFAMIKFTQTQYAAPEKSEEEIVAAYKKERSYRQDIQETERQRKPYFAGKNSVYATCNDDNPPPHYALSMLSPGSEYPLRHFLFI